MNEQRNNHAETHAAKPRWTDSFRLNEAQATFGVLVIVLLFSALAQTLGWW